MAPRKLRCQPSSIWWRFLTWMMQPPQSVIEYGITTSWMMPAAGGCTARRWSPRDRGVDVVVVQHVDAERNTIGLLAGLRIVSGDVERWRLVGFSHIARPLRMEMVAALHAGSSASLVSKRRSRGLT